MLPPLSFRQAFALLIALMAHGCGGRGGALGLEQGTQRENERAEARPPTSSGSASDAPASVGRTPPTAQPSGGRPNVTDPAATGGIDATGGVGGLGGLGGAVTLRPGTQPLDPPWDMLLGHYFLYVIPDDPDCYRLGEGVHFGLRMGESGPEARLFRDYEWNGWPDEVAVLEEERQLRITPHARASLGDAFTSDGLLLPYDEEGFTPLRELEYGSATLVSPCDGAAPDAATVGMTPDTIAPQVRVTLTTTHYLYPFTWALFRFSEPVNIQDDSHPYGSFTDQALAESLISVTSFDGENMAEHDTSFAQWPWGPVYGLVFDDYDQVRDTTVSFGIVGNVHDAAGNSVVEYISTGYVIDPGPLAAVQRFNESPSVGKNYPYDYVPPGGGGLCEGADGCVILTQYPDHCHEDGSFAAPMDSVSFRVGGPHVGTDGGMETSGFRLRYRVLSRGGTSQNEVVVQTGTTDDPLSLATPQPLATPIDRYSHATDWLEVEYSNPLGPSDELAAALHWACPGEETPDRALIVERIEAVGWNPYR